MPLTLVSHLKLLSILKVLVDVFISFKFIYLFFTFMKHFSQKAVHNKHALESKLYLYMLCFSGISGVIFSELFSLNL